MPVPGAPVQRVSDQRTAAPAAKPPSAPNPPAASAAPPGTPACGRGLQGAGRRLETVGRGRRCRCRSTAGCCPGRLEPVAQAVAVGVGGQRRSCPPSAPARSLTPSESLSSVGEAAELGGTDRVRHLRRGRRPSARRTRARRSGRRDRCRSTARPCDSPTSRRRRRGRRRRCRTSSCPCRTAARTGRSARPGRRRSPTAGRRGRWRRGRSRPAANAAPWRLPPRSGSGCEEVEGLTHWPPVLADLEVQVVRGTRGVTGVPDAADHLSRVDVLADLEVVRAAPGEVRVVVEAPVVALDADDVAAEPVREALHDRAAGDGVDRRALRGEDVDALVLAAAGPRGAVRVGQLRALDAAGRATTAARTRRTPGSARSRGSAARDRTVPAGVRHFTRVRAPRAIPR